MCNATTTPATGSGECKQSSRPIGSGQVSNNGPGLPRIDRSQCSTALEPQGPESNGQVGQVGGVWQVFGRAATGVTRAAIDGANKMT